MKKFSLFLLLAISAGVALVSCSKGDDNGGTSKPKPTVSLAWDKGAGFTEQNGSINAGDIFSLRLISNPSSGEKLKTAKILVSVSGGPETQLWDTTFSESSFTYTVAGLPAGSLAGAKVKYTATVSQSNGESQSGSFTLTVVSAAKEVQVNPGVIMGAQNNATYGSFFDVEQNQAIKLGQANANPGAADIIYYYGSSNLATFSAANDPQITQVFPSIANWSTKNATSFRKSTMTASTFDAIAVDAGSTSTSIDNEASTGTYTTKVAQLAAGNVIVYITAGSQNYGLAKVTSISIGGAGSIEFDLKFPKVQ